MRATRAYIAGFGTAGSLVAGAAIVFVTASAVVAFRGWPQVANTATPAALVVGHTHAVGISRTGRRLTAAAATHRVAPVVTSARPSGASKLAGSAGTQRSAVQIAVVQPPLRAHHVAPVAVGPTGTTTPPSGGCSSSCSSPTAPVATTVQNTTGAVGTGVTGAGKTLGSAVTGIVGTVANKLSGVDPALGGTVNQVGTTLGNTVAGTTSTAGQLVSGTGKTLGGLVSGLTHH